MTNEWMSLFLRASVCLRVFVSECYSWKLLVRLSQRSMAWMGDETGNSGPGQVQRETCEGACRCSAAQIGSTESTEWSCPAWRGDGEMEIAVP